ncbi:MAG: hypothetical protein M3Y27_08890 [Acidobacteriota bacterium]|nr:hypothetical protein [Acidobacteriota bacterium]
MHSLEDLLAEVKSTAREQLQAASQLQLDRIHEQIAGAWHSDLERIMEERLSDAATRIEDWHLSDAGSKLADLAANARLNARRDLAEQLGRAVRRLRDFESEQQWSQALLDGTKGFCDRAAVFIVNGPSLELRAVRGIEPQMEKQAALKVALSAAPAFATAVETKDTVVAMRTRGELSEPVASLVGESPGHRSSLFPLTTRDRVPALLYADSTNQDIEPAALEMLCSVASAVLESVANRRPESSELVKIVGNEPEPARATTWFALDREEQNLHLRAQRFARVLVAEMRLYKAQAVKSGRTERDLYKHLQSDIDKGRQTFRNDFLSKSNSMVDYLHLELVRTLANEDAGLLGSQYPGPMA